MTQLMKNLNLQQKMACYRHSNSKKKIQTKQLYNIWDRKY